MYRAMGVETYLVRRSRESPKWPQAGMIHKASAFVIASEAKQSI
jgi:hypothetical protein